MQRFTGIYVFTPRLAFQSGMIADIIDGNSMPPWGLRAALFMAGGGG